ncbi:protein ACCELERATED CELL DEATH 6 [Beta vulgaris subsp. vulgaris]|uniref:protein ACCELERATED CELL DEATH 6 n=1 Tax=Beta vulgaris subsp. vulgaris TaxID=3555 RepID=UPI00203691FD|nr:protein ACCELERATED CELL DEATH 6 [Beta vulgaris subsp. vulgaris]
MAVQQQHQQLPTNDHQLQGDPSSISSARMIRSSLSSLSILSSTTSTLHSSPKTTINAAHYAMLLNNDINGLKGVVDEGGKFSDLVWESDNSTILHLAASTGSSNIIELIIQQSPELLQVQNLNGDLPIHVAAKSCQLDAVKKLVLGDISMLERENHDDYKNTALHIALENQQEEMAKFLFRKCPKTFYQLNKQGISPLYLAIKAEFWELVRDMLSEDVVAAYPDAENQLLEGKSVVHAAIIAKKIDILEMILKEYSELLYKTTDEMGRRPLSYAAYIGFHDGVKYIIDTFINQAFKIDNNGFFPIHSACSGGNMKVVKEFFTKLPTNSRLLLNKKGQNILHVAAASGKAEVVKYVLRQPELETMINMKDEDGNTPLLLGAKEKHPEVVYVLTWDERVKLTVQNKGGCTALDIAEDYGDDVPSFDERLTWLALRYAGVPRAPQLHYFNINYIDAELTTHNLSSAPLLVNNHHRSTTFMAQNQPLTLVQSHSKTKRKIKYKERINTLLLVSTLVATVTYASGSSIPGGYNNDKPDEGMATLAHKCAFQVFVITNTIAMYSAILAAVTLIWAHLDDLRLVLLSLDFALPLLGISLAMMSVAFMAALYVVLHTIVSWLGIMVLIMGGVFLSALFVFFIPLYSPTSCIRIKILRYVFHVPFTLMLLACEKGISGVHY